MKPWYAEGEPEARMGIAQIKEAFNAVAQPRFTADRATLHYARDEGPGPQVEWQVLTFYGTAAAGGSAFTTESARLGPDTDLLKAARETAQAMLDKEAAPS